MEDRLYSPSLMLADWLIHYNKYVMFQFTSIQFFFQRCLCILCILSKCSLHFAVIAEWTQSVFLWWPCFLCLLVSVSGFFFFVPCQVASQFLFEVYAIMCTLEINPLTRPMWLSYRNKRICFIWEWWGQILVKHRH